MSAICRYVAPNTDCINGLPRPEHHFWLDISEHDDHMEVANWITHNFAPYSYQFWPETVNTSPATCSMQFHVILHKDRDAVLFKVRW